MNQSDKEASQDNSNDTTKSKSKKKKSWKIDYYVASMVVLVIFY